MKSLIALVTFFSVSLAFAGDRSPELPCVGSICPTSPSIKAMECKPVFPTETRITQVIATQEGPTSTSNSVHLSIQVLDNGGQPQPGLINYERVASGTLDFDPVFLDFYDGSLITFHSPEGALHAALNFLGEEWVELECVFNGEPGHLVGVSN
jgi:hypothetical protein